MPEEVVDDLLQEAAAVVLRRQPTFATGDDLAPYVRVVVRRLAYRWTRRRGREVVGVVPDRPLTHSVAELAEHRLRLRGAVQAFATLSPVQQGRLRAYLGAESPVGDLQQRARERKQVERIRTTMSRIADGLAAAFGWVRMRTRWLEGVAPQTVSAALAITGFVALLVPSDPQPVQVAAAAAAPAAASSAAQPPPRNGAHEAQPPVPAERPAPARRSPGTSPPPGNDGQGTRHVVRVTTPAGEDAGWKKDGNPTGSAVVCVQSPLVGKTCVEDPRTLRPLG